MKKISARLSARLVRQRREMFALATHPFESIEQQALSALNASEGDYVQRVAFRRWWIDLVGDLPAEWENRLATRLAPIVSEVEAELKASSARHPWVDLGFVARTLDVLQRRRLTTLRSSAALRALQSVGRLAVLVDQS